MQVIPRVEMVNNNLPASVQFRLGPIVSPPEAGFIKPPPILVRMEVQRVMSAVNRWLYPED